MTADQPYVNKTPFTVFEYDTDADGNAIRESNTSPFVTSPLFTLASSASDTVYLQVEVVLRDVAGLEQNRFTGSVLQEYS